MMTTEKRASTVGTVDTPLKVINSTNHITSQYQVTVGKLRRSKGAVKGLSVLVYEDSPFFKYIYSHVGNPYQRNMVIYGSHFDAEQKELVIDFTRGSRQATPTGVKGHAKYYQFSFSMTHVSDASYFAKVQHPSEDNISFSDGKMIIKVKEPEVQIVRPQKQAPAATSVDANRLADAVVDKLLDSNQFMQSLAAAVALHLTPKLNEMESQQQKQLKDMMREFRTLMDIRWSKPRK